MASRPPGQLVTSPVTTTLAVLPPAPQPPATRTSARRAVPRQQRSIDRWSEILDAAEEVFRREGIDNATTVQVAKEAGISVGTLYHYVTDKHALADALSERYLDQLVRFAEALVVDDPTLATPDLLHQMLTEVARLDAVNSGFREVLLSGADPNRGPNRLLDAFQTQAEAVISARTVEVSDRDRRRIARTCVFTVVTMVNQLASTSRRDRKDVVEEYSALLTGYLAARFPSPGDPVWDDPDPAIAPVAPSIDAGGSRIVLSPNRQLRPPPPTP